MKYMAKALFIYDEQSAELIETVTNNDFGTEIIAVEKNKFLNDPLEYVFLSRHLVLSGSMELINQLLAFAYAHSANGQQCSLGFLPLESQQTLLSSYQLSTNLQDNIEIALREDTKAINLLECNGQLVQFKAVIGRIPLLKSWQSDSSSSALMRNVILGIKQFFRLSLDKLTIETARDKVLKTVASGVFVVNQNQGSRLSRVLQHSSSMRSERVSMLIISPYSAIEYFLFLFALIFNFSKNSSLPHAVSNIQSSQLTLNIETLGKDVPEVKLDDINTATFPLHFKVIKNAVKINAPETFWTLNPVSSAEKEVIRIENLPDEKEMGKYYNKHLPFFSVASEERFKDLFLQLRTDSRISSIYIVLMLLSTLIAGFGLFANSAAVVIGAMLLAPLMSPIISFSMGLLRGDEMLLNHSIIKILAGVVLAVTASCLLTLLLPQTGLSDEIKTRIHPNLIDLGIAIFSGMAAAYTKSHKELLSSLAGVAIAVALVPPLTVVGIGLGRGEAYVFEGALLLFVTNLIGITIAAVMTFQFLGFSNTVKSKKSLWVLLGILAVLSYPLHRAYQDSIQRYELTKSLLDERIVINQKHIVIENADIGYQNNKKIIHITIVLKNPLNDKELQVLKEKIGRSFTSGYETRVSMKFIL